MDKPNAHIPITLMSEIVEENGKTIRENNMEKQHLLREGQEVRVRTCDEWKDDHVHDDHCPDKVAFILLCGRDCDGTPLYWVGGKAQWSEIERFGAERTIENMLWRIQNCVEGGYSEDALKPYDAIAEFRKLHAWVEQEAER